MLAVIAALFRVLEPLHQSFHLRPCRAVSVFELVLVEVSRHIPPDPPQAKHNCGEWDRRDPEDPELVAQRGLPSIRVCLPVEH